MANTATNRKRTRSNEDAEDLNKRRRKTDNSSAIGKANNRKPSINPTPKRATNEKIDSKETTQPRKKPASKQVNTKKIDGKKPIQPRKKRTKKTPESLVNTYYFKAPQEPNSNPEWIDYDIRVATPEEIRNAIETKCVGWSEEALVKEREARRKKLWG
jgi:hypothetical protein